MNPRRPAIITAAAFLAAAAAPAFAQHQLLDLSGGASAPAAGSCRGATSLADELEFQAKAMDRTGDPQDRARAAVRRLASALLQTGERAGLPGSTRVLIGRTLAGGMAGIDEAVGTVSGAGSAATLQIIVGDATTAAHTLEAPGADPWRTVRDGLAVLAQQAPADAAPGWASATTGEAPAAPIAPEQAAEWAKLPGVRPDIAKGIASLETTLSAGASWNAYRPSASRVRSLVVRSAEGLTGLPAWVPAPSRQHLGEEFTRAVDGLLDRKEQAAAEGRLARIARFAALASRTDALDNSPAGQKVRTAFAQAMAAPAPDPAGERQALDAYERALELTAEKWAAEDERLLARPLRPAWKSLAGMFKQAEPQLYAALPDLAKRSDAMTDPGIIAIVNSQRQLAGDLRALRQANELFAGEATGDGKEPEVRQPWARLSARFLKLGQDVSKPAQREASLRSLHDLLSQITACCIAIPDEDRLTDPQWDALVGGRGADLHDAIEKHRAAWLAAAEKGEPATDEAARLGALRSLLETLAELTAIEPSGLPGALSEPYQRLQACAGWELSGAALADLVSGLKGQVGTAVAAAMDESPAKTGTALAALRKDHAVLLLAGRLSLDAAKRGIPPRGDHGAVLVEIGTGGPAHPAWLADQATDLAAICRYAEEVPVARKNASKDVAESARKFANQAALKVLNSLSP